MNAKTMPRTLLILLFTNVLLWFAFAGQLRSDAAPQEEKVVKSLNPAAQRNEIIRELGQIRSLLQEQNRLMKEAMAK